MKKSKSHLCFVLLIFCSLLSFFNSAEAQTTQLSARDLCPTYQVDARVVDNIDFLDNITDSLQRIEPNAYPLASEWCRQQRLRMMRMMRSLRDDYTWDGDMVWMDSTHCITDAAAFVDKMQHTAEALAGKAENFDRLEQERIEEVRRAEEERAKAEAARIQREKDLRLAAVKDTIKTLHNSITAICDAKGITDKAQINELKNIYYSYRSVYNRYDLTSDKTDNSRFSQLDELKEFQSHLLDSILGQNSYPQRISGFSNTLKVRSGKDHNEVYKSYMKVYKRMFVPVGFKTIAEYNEYVGQLRDVTIVQQSYLDVIDLRDTIARNAANLQTLCAKKHRDIFSTYKDIHNEVNTIPSYVNLDASRRFIATLQEFTVVQQAYAATVKRIDAIQSRGDSITALCTKNLSDIATAYKSLVTSSNFIPNFINKSSADHYNTTLDDFERVQRQYVEIIGLRKKIETNSSRILENKSAPRIITNGYKQMQRNTTFTPYFSNVAGGKDFISLLNHFIGIQEQFDKIISQYGQIEANTKQFKIAFKDYGNIYRAYTKILESYNYDVSILSETDLNTYMKYQTTVLEMQSHFAELVNSMEKDDYNHRLKKVKEVDKIKLIMNLK